MSMPKKTMAALDAYNLSCTSTTECSSDFFTAPPDTPSLVNHESEATKFDAAVSLTGFPKTGTARPLSCLKPTDLQEYVDIVRAASQKPDKQTPPATLITSLGSHERACIESIFCSDDPVDAIEKYYSLSFSIRSESVFLNADFPLKFLNTNSDVPNRHCTGPFQDILGTCYDQMKQVTDKYAPDIKLARRNFSPCPRNTSFFDRSTLFFHATVKCPKT